MNDREKWRERVRDIRVSDTTWWWWWWYIYRGWDNIMETPGNFKFILIWFSNCNPPVKSGFVLIPYNSFWGNWDLEIVIELRCNWRNCILAILPNNPRKSPTAFAFFQNFASVKRFFLLSQMLSFYFRDYTK